MTFVKKLALNNAVLINQLGYGVYQVPADKTAELCLQAFEAGYRHIDTAALYGNEAGVGQAVREFIDWNGVDRSELFVTTKVWNTDHGYDATLRAFDASLERLGLEHVDLYLIHWPCPHRKLYGETYRALERLYHEGRVRSIGVSNFQPEHLARLLDAADVVPAVNQIELHPWLQQEKLRAFHSAHGILTEAWSPLGGGAVLRDPDLKALARRMGCSVAQLILAWHLQIGNVAIPKASSLPRLQENIGAARVTLAPADMELIAGLERGHRTGKHPDMVN